MMRRNLVAALLVSSLLAGSVTVRKNINGGRQCAWTLFVRRNNYANPNSIGDLKWFEVFKDEELQSSSGPQSFKTTIFAPPSREYNAERANLGLARSNQFPQLKLEPILRRHVHLAMVVWI